MELLDNFNLEQKREQFYKPLAQATIAYECIPNLLEMYLLKQEYSIVKAQNEVALSMFLPTNRTLLLKDEKPKKAKIKYETPQTWSEAFKLIKLLWQTRQLA
mgnify:CR=1 FL=1|jgi:hypothetical protein